MIYLDNAATSWPKPKQVYQAVNDCLHTAGANPGRGSHLMARQAGTILADARDQLAGLFNVADSEQIVFTLNATAAINMALFGLVKPGWRIVTTAVEHNAVARPLRQLEKQGAKLLIVGCDAEGQLKKEELMAALSGGAEMVIAGHASNVTGVIMPIAEIGAMARKAGALFAIDAAQTAGVEEIDVAAMNIDLLAFAGHKSLYGPQGTGGLYINPEIKLAPRCFGGTGSMSESDLQPEFLPDMLESGTPNTPGIAGLKAGVEYIRATGLTTIRGHERKMTAALLQGLAEIPGVKIYGPPSSKERAAVICLTVDGMDSGEMAHLLDRDYDIACRSGLHCAPWAHRTLGTLSSGALRLSPGYFTTPGEVKNAVEAIAALARKGGSRERYTC